MGNAESSLVEALSSACQGTDDTASQPQVLADLENFLVHLERVWSKLPVCVTNAIKSRFLPCFASSTDPEAWVLHQIFSEAPGDKATYLYDELDALSASTAPSDMTRFDFAKRNVWLVAFARIRNLHGDQSAMADHIFARKQQGDKVRKKCSDLGLAGERLGSVLDRAGGPGALIYGLRLSLTNLARYDRFKKVAIETSYEPLVQANIRRCNKIVDVLLTLYESQASTCQVENEQDAGSSGAPQAIDSPSKRAAHSSSHGPVAAQAWPSHSFTDDFGSPSTATIGPITPPDRETYGEGIAEYQELSSGQASNAAPSIGDYIWYKLVPGNIQQQPSTSPNTLFHKSLGAGQQFLHLIVNDAYSPRPQLQLPMQREVPDTAPSIRYALEGNIRGLCHLFQTGLASPVDVSYSRGYSLIRWALYGGMHQYETVKYLMSQGAPVDKESYDHVWDFGFRKRCTNEELEALSCIRNTPYMDWIDEQEFPLIHRIIFGLGLHGESLSDVLKDNPDAVNRKDAQGRTALDWATARAQLHDMKLLIEHGADVNTMDVNGRTTVLHAVDSHSDAALQIVLEAGANPNPDIPEGLRRSSPLTSASFGGLKEMVRLLLDFGADVDACNPEGRTPLATSIIHNKYEVLKLFTNKCNKYIHLGGSQLLPVIAEHADEQTMSILRSYHLFLKTPDSES
ncbi:ankyrin repeat containing protein [Colletotrichum tofieldiae]|uniref:Ankyrin repeat containing protein n=1 Tax=Colletotrichum tofieldiae TaxID=708197 RepID=A0A166SB18_9PEZI|nr:ankyrin repeat containing protein [Colletotrichum tofieldiae]